MVGNKSEGLLQACISSMYEDKESLLFIRCYVKLTDLRWLEEFLRLCDFIIML